MAQTQQGNASDLATHSPQSLEAEMTPYFRTGG